MRLSIYRIKGLAYIIWHARHEMYHVLLGLMWAWVVRENFAVLDMKLIFLAILGGLLPDADHFFYFFTYGKNDVYNKQIRDMLRRNEWRKLTVFIEHGHKSNTSLSTHSVYTLGALIIVTMIAWHMGYLGILTLTGAMVTHYTFDIVDDVLILGKINKNWFRWGRAKEHAGIEYSK